MGKMKTWATLAAILFSAAPGWAQTNDPSLGNQGSNYEFAISGSGVTSRGDTGDLDQTSAGATGSLGYWLDGMTEISLRQTVNFMDKNQPGSSTVASTRAALDIHFPLGRFRPFVGANFGLIYGDVVRHTDNIIGPEAGFKYYLRPQTFIVLMAEYQVRFNRWKDVDKNWDNAGVAYTLGMGFNW